MKNALLNGLIWKLPLIGLSILLLHVEVKEYTDTKGSIGQLMLLSYHEHSFLLGSVMILVVGLALLLTRNEVVKIVLVCIICFLVFLFFPSWDMQGVTEAF
jgi:hypothetical protein